MSLLEFLHHGHRIFTLLFLSPHLGLHCCQSILEAFDLLSLIAELFHHLCGLMFQLLNDLLEVSFFFLRILHSFLEYKLLCLSFLLQLFPNSVSHLGLEIFNFIEFLLALLEVTDGLAHPGHQPLPILSLSRQSLHLLPQDLVLILKLLHTGTAPRTGHVIPAVAFTLMTHIGVLGDSPESAHGTIIEE